MSNYIPHPFMTQLALLPPLGGVEFGFWVLFGFGFRFVVICLVDLGDFDIDFFVVILLGW